MAGYTIQSNRCGLNPATNPDFRYVPTYALATQLHAPDNATRTIRHMFTCFSANVICGILSHNALLHSTLDNLCAEN